MKLPFSAVLVESLGTTTVRVGAAALIAFGCLTTASVVLRPFGGVITGAPEISEMLVIVMASMSLVAATVSEAHPRVHMIVDRMNVAWRRRIAACVSLGAALFWALAAFVNGRVTIENARVIEETELLRISLIPFRALWTFALCLIAMILVVRALAPRIPPPDETH